MKPAILAAFLVAGCATPPAEPVTPPTSIVVETMNGTSYDIDDLLDQGQQVALMFWQPWCDNCLDEAPRVMQASTTQADSAKFFGVVSGPNEAVNDMRVENAAFELGLSYPQVRDRDLSLTNYLNVTEVPTFVILGPNREIVYRGRDLPAQWPTAPAAIAPGPGVGKGGSSSR